MLVPLIPEPMITTSAETGSEGDCRSVRFGNGGLRSQKGLVGFGTGRVGGVLIRPSRILNSLDEFWISRMRARMLR